MCHPCLLFAVCCFCFCCPIPPPTGALKPGAQAAYMLPATFSMEGFKPGGDTGYGLTIAAGTNVTIVGEGEGSVVLDAQQKGGLFRVYGHLILRGLTLKNSKVRERERRVSGSAAAAAG